MVTEIDRLDAGVIGDPAFQSPGPSLDLSKRSQYLTPRVENRGRVSFPRQRLPPRSQQGVVRFHPLRAGMTAPKFATRFQT